MANYKLPQWHVEIQNPQIDFSIESDRFKGNASIWAVLSLGAPNANAASFGFLLGTYNYTGDQAMKADVEIWGNNELIQYEI